MLLSPLRYINPISGNRGGSAVFSIAKSFYLDGVNEYFNADDVLPLLSTTTKGTWLFSLKNITTANFQDIIVFADSASPLNAVYCYISNIGKITFRSFVAGAEKFRVETTSTTLLNDGLFHTLAFIQDGVNPRILVDGVLIAQTTPAAVDKTVWFNDFSTLDNVRIGAAKFNGIAEQFFYNGYINQIGFFNDDLSNEEVLNWHNENKPKNVTSIRNCVENFNPDNSGDTSQFTVIGDVNASNFTSVNMEDADKTTETPY
jgi:hypothetical protein